MRELRHVAMKAALARLMNTCGQLSDYRHAAPSHGLVQLAEGIIVVVSPAYIDRSILSPKVYEPLAAN